MYGSDAAARSGRRRGAADDKLTPLILTFGDALHLVSVHQIRQRDITQKFLDLLTKIRPQMVGQAGFALLTITSALTASCVYTLIDRVNDIDYGDSIGGTPESVTTAGTPNADNQLLPAQARKQLLQIGQ